MVVYRKHGEKSMFFHFYRLRYVHRNFSSDTMNSANKNRTQIFVIFLLLVLHKLILQQANP